MVTSRKTDSVTDPAVGSSSDPGPEEMKQNSSMGWVLYLSGWRVSMTHLAQDVVGWEWA